MPINIPENLPAFNTLVAENISIITNDKALHQDIRPLKIAILNLMPKKIETETQLLRLLSNTPLQVDIELIQMTSHVSKTTPQEHMLAFYQNFEDVKNNRYDGLIITGAPVEQIDFEKVDYWNELKEVFEWSKTNVFSTIHICWGAQASLYYHYGINKYPLKEKMFGIFPHEITNPNHHLLKGFNEYFYVPHSRHTTISEEEIRKVANLEILSYSNLSGIYIVADKSGRQFFITGHSEYDKNTLSDEYFRDKKKGLDITLPYNYFPDDDENKTPKNIWSGTANLMYSNWLNYCVYQQTPFSLDNISPLNI